MSSGHFKLMRPAALIVLYVALIRMPISRTWERSKEESLYSDLLL